MLLITVNGRGQKKLNAEDVCQCLPKLITSLDSHCTKALALAECSLDGFHNQCQAWLGHVAEYACKGFLDECRAWLGRVANCFCKGFHAQCGVWLGSPNALAKVFTLNADYGWDRSPNARTKVFTLNGQQGGHVLPSAPAKAFQLNAGAGTGCQMPMQRFYTQCEAWLRQANVEHS
jgi:hypothetical protein